MFDFHSNGSPPSILENLNDIACIGNRRFDAPHSADAREQ
jgi:hypothetical protein